MTVKMNRTNIALTSLLVFFMLTQYANGQTSQDPRSYILPSPTAMAFQKYGDYPVDMSTGVPQIEIPLYTISLKDYSFSISASFHASGRSTALNLSPLGMNWALMANGLITREVRGKVDESVGSHLEKSPDDLSPQGQHYDDVSALDPDNYSGNSKDNEYDIYTLSINGLSAKFIRRDDGSIVFLNYCPYSIVFISGGFTVTDDSGNVYKFGGDGAGNGFAETDYGGGAHTSAWYIASITTTSGSIIQFKYGTQFIFPSTFLGNRFYMDQLEIQDGEYFNPYSIYQGASGQSVFDSYYNPRNSIKQTNPVSAEDFSLSYLKEIDFDNGKVSFSYNSTSASFLLDKCVVSNNSNTTIKNIQFAYFTSLPGTDLFLQNNNSVTIKSIDFLDIYSFYSDRYSFDYYPGIPGGDQASFAKQKDWWGYCNTSYSEKKIPIATVTIDHASPIGSVEYNTKGSTSCKEPSFDAKLVGMVKAIHYPTGGTTVFNYEPNKYTDHDSATKNGPGIRIHQIISHDGYGHQTGKTYEYSGGYILREPSIYDYFTEKIRMLFVDNNPSGTLNTDYIGSYKYRLYSSEPVAEAQTANRYPVFYSGVTEYDYSTDNTKNGKTIYSYTSPSFKSTSSFVSSPGSTTGGTGYFAPQVFSYYEWSKPQLQSKVVQKFDPVSSSYKTLTSQTINYVLLNSINVPQVILYKYLEFPMGSHTYPLSDGVYEKKVIVDPNLNYSVYSLLDKTISSAVKKPEYQTTVTYDDGGHQLTSTVNYFYDNLTHLNPTRVVTTTSDAKTITKFTTFPLDYPAGTGFVDGLTTRHIWNSPVEEVSVQTVGGISKMLAGKITTYSGAVVNQVLQMESRTPVDQSDFKFSNRPVGSLPFTGTATAFAIDSRYKAKLTYNDYDSKNNPLTITPTSNTPVAYLWGYNQMYPIAEVKNAVNKDIFYTGFEESEGNSTSGDAKAGLFSYSGSYSKTLSNLDNGSYILSYWQKSGGSWILQSSKVPVTTGGFTISLSGQIDEVRFYPANAQMTTYTYTPLLGLTSQSDVNNKLQYYEYDSFLRLKHIRDKDNNIIKRVEYFTTNPLFYSAARTFAMLKNDCDPALYLGSSVNYTVDDYAYSSSISQADADSKRDADISRNAQSYANANGNCYNFKNEIKNQTFAKSCGSGLYGTAFTYTVPYGRYTALSQPAANQKAIDDINANGQTAANNDPNGRCLTYAQLFKNDEMTQTFTKYCGFGYEASPVTYTVPYARYTSANNLEEANNLAIADLDHNGQDQANQNTCNALPMQTIYASNSTHYDMTVRFSYSDKSSPPYTVPQGQINFPISVVTGKTYTVYITSPNSNTYHFYLGGVPMTGSSATYYNAQPDNISITN